MDALHDEMLGAQTFSGLNEEQTKADTKPAKHSASRPTCVGRCTLWQAIRAFNIELPEAHTSASDKDSDRFCTFLAKLSSSMLAYLSRGQTLASFVLTLHLDACMTSYDASASHIHLHTPTKIQIAAPAESMLDVSTCLREFSSPPNLILPEHLPSCFVGSAWTPSSCIDHDRSNQGTDL